MTCFRTDVSDFDNSTHVAWRPAHSFDRKHSMPITGLAVGCPVLWRGFMGYYTAMHRLLRR